ncbi:MAG: hypothetical protein RBQ96_06425 [Candidatus Methanomethylophilaceae archaeon]|nr:hypothetical protein [Candidatus Methanomethylophilaceae archaeon]
MRVVLFLLCAFLGALHAQESWYDKFKIGVEAGLFMNDFDGDIQNATPSTTTFQEELHYKDTDSSFFALRISNDVPYVPDVDISYMNVTQNKNAVLVDKKVVTLGADYNGTVRSQIDYSVLNVVLKATFKHKGSMQKFLRWDFYSGDIEYSLGVNAKTISYRFDIENEDGSLPSFITVDALIPLPHAGVRYYWYDFVVYAHASALSFSDAKAMNYEYGLDYRLFNGFFISASYMHEEFEATERRDTVKFESYGNKFSVKYLF